MKQQFLEDTAEAFQTYIYENNRRVVPASAILTVYMPASTVKLIDAQTMTVGSDGLLSYGLTAAHNDTADENYKAVIAYVYNSRTYYLTLFYDVVKSKVVKVITDEDLIAELPQLKDSGWRVHGTADSGSTTTIVDAELKRYEDDYFTGGLAYSIPKDESREISDFFAASGTITVASAFSAAISAGEKYILTRSFSKEIQRAFEKIEELLNRSGKRAHLILDPYDLREVHIYYAVSEACKGLATEENTFWWTMWQEYEKKADGVFKNLNFKYDASNDGYIAAGEEGKRFTSIKAGRG